MVYVKLSKCLNLTIPITMANESYSTHHATLTVILNDYQILHKP